MRSSEFAAVLKRIVPAFAGYDFKRSLLFANPIGTLIRGVDFDTSGFERTSFYITKFVLPLCVPKTYLSFTFGERISPPTAPFGWDACRPDLDAQLVASITQDAMPFLSAVASLQDFIRHVEAGLRTARTLEALGYSLVRVGEFDRAIAVFDELLPRPDRSIAWQKELAERVEKLRQAVMDDPQTAQAQVIAIEAETVANLGLEKFWKGPSALRG